MVDVVAALIAQDNQFYIFLRGREKANPLLWEFPGGKVEPGETREQALIRECMEECKIHVYPIKQLAQVQQDNLCLTLYETRLTAGKIKLTEHQDVKLIGVADVNMYSFCPMDAKLLLQLKTFFNELQQRKPQSELSVVQALHNLQDKNYRDFNAKLIPDVSLDKIIGVRSPALRQYAKSIKNTDKAKEFVNTLPHVYFEENNLHGILVSEIKDWEQGITLLERFLPHVDNWATCDLLSPKCFENHDAQVLQRVEQWMSSDHPYTVLFGINVLMDRFLGERFEERFLYQVVGVKRQEYYIKMMIAWYFATALAKQYDSAIQVIQGQLLDKWTHNKAIQKALESYRVSDEHKKILKTLKRK